MRISKPNTAKRKNVTGKRSSINYIINNRDNIS